MFRALHKLAAFLGLAAAANAAPAENVLRLSVNDAIRMGLMRGGGKTGKRDSKHQLRARAASKRARRARRDQRRIARERGLSRSHP